MSIMRTFLQSYPGKLLLLAVLYILTGKLGLMLALPPGYATVIWPPSGIAIGMLIVYGCRLWPGVLIGSFILNCYISSAYSLDTGLDTSKAFAALGIAFGSALQAIAGCIIARRLFGKPIRIGHIRQVVSLFVVCGPLACLIASSIGVSTLLLTDVITADQFIGNWLTWWLGDTFGVLVFMPLVLVAPGSGSSLEWRGNRLGSLPAVAMLALIMPLGLTFYAWKITSENVLAQQRTEFEAIALENQNALKHRIDSYEHALLGGIAYFLGSKSVERDEWRSYVNTINIRSNFPGVGGVGFIKHLTKDAVPEFLEETRKDGAPDFNIHPETEGRPYYVIKYIEPETENNKAIGLNIGFEDNRTEAANLSRDSGKPAITKKIILVQDAQKTPGFLLLHPLYHKGTNPGTTEERREAHEGWIYAPFIAKEFLHELTKSQGVLLNIRVYDGDKESADNLIYSSGGDIGNDHLFTVRKQLNIMQQKWLVVWTSTGDYEKKERSDEPLFVMVGGLLFTGLFGLFLMVVAVRRTETMEWIAHEKSYILPLAIFGFCVLGTYELYDTLRAREKVFVHNTVAEQAEKIRALIDTDTNSKLLALKRMALRWEAANGTPEKLWRKDSYNYVGHMAGLRALEWVDSTYHVRWVEPVQGNEKVIGLNILFNKERENALRGAAERETITITPPIDLVQGYKAFIAYAPVKRDGKFDGFMTGLFSVDEFFSQSISQEAIGNFDIVLEHEDKPFYENKLPPENIEISLASKSFIQAYDKQWVLKLIPSKEFTRSNYTSLPEAILAAGLLIAGLLSLTVRAVLIAKIRNTMLIESETRQQQLVDGIQDYAIYWLDTKGYIESWNSGATRIKGYEAHEIIGKNFSVFYTPEDIKANKPILALDTARIEGKFEGEGWRLRKDGSRFWANILIEPLYAQTGELLGFAKITQDASERRELEQERSRLISIIEESTDFIGMSDLEGNLLYHNQSAKQLVGLPADYDMSKLNIADMHPEWAGKIVLKEGIPEVYKKGFWKGETALKHQESGHEIPVLQTLTLHRDAQGNPSCLTTIMRDITERKQQEQVLKASEETFRAAMEAATIGMALVRPDGRWLKVNQSLLNMLGYERNELLANDFQSITYADDLEADLNYVRRVLAGEIENYQMEKRYYHKTGRIIWAQLSVSIVRNADGTPNYFVSQIQDITEQKEIERIKSEFISIVSHELRTPLTSIRGSLGLILGAFAKGLPDKVKNLLDIAHNNCERLILLINDILDIDKIAAGQMHFDMHSESLADITQQAVKANEAYAQKFDVHIVLQPIDSSVRIEVDAARYIQVLSNLLSNAVKFSSAGAEVTVSAMRSGKFIRVSVSDKGPGIPEEFRSRIFGKFSQADSSVTRAKGGTGLGLHIAKQMVERMHGNIGFDTKVRKGTTFWVEFPIVDTGPDKNMYIENELIQKAEQSKLPLILHVEDDADLSNVLATALHEKAQLITALTIRNAEQLLKTKHFSMMILDIGMPDGNGLDLLDRLHELSNELLPVVILSADLPPEDVHKRVEAVMVKSRMSETKIVETVLMLLQKHVRGGNDK